MIVTWEIDDGYVGAQRPHTTDVDDDELAECETEAEREDVIASFIEEDFHRTVGWSEIGRDE